MPETDSKPPTPEEFIQQFAGFALQQDLGFLVPANTPFHTDELDSPITQMMKGQVVATRGQVLTESLNLEKQLCFLCGITDVDGTFAYDHSRVLNNLNKTMGTVIKNFTNEFPWNLVSEPNLKADLLPELENAKNIRNRFAHDLAGLAVYRYSYVTPYLPVLLGKDGIILISHEMMLSFSQSVQKSQALISQLRALTGKF